MIFIEQISGYHSGLFWGMISGMIPGMQNIDRDMTPTTPVTRACRVVKLGGSLLDVPHLAARLQNWLAGEPDKLTLLLVGGGEFVEAMRQLDRVHDFDSAWCHWKCLELMAHTSSLVEQLLPGWSVIRTEEQLSLTLTDASSTREAIVRTAAFYNRAATGEASASSFPESWQTSSDSIAALLAVRVGAEELVLLKSTLPQEVASGPEAGGALDRLQQWTLQGYVDEHFRHVASPIPHVRAVDLRASQIRESAS